MKSPQKGLYYMMMLARHYNQGAIRDIAYEEVPVEKFSGTDFS